MHKLKYWIKANRNEPNSSYASFKIMHIPFTSHYLLLHSFQSYKSKVKNFVIDIEGKRPNSIQF